MALLKMGPVVADIRGSIGGVVFSRNAAGAIARARIVPVNPASQFQNFVRNSMSYLQMAWREILTEANRTSWNELAAVTTFTNRMGEDFKPSGLNLFIRCNTQALLFQESVITTAPDRATGAIPSLTIEHSATLGLQITALQGADISSGNIAVFLSAPLTDTINYFKGPFRFHDTLAVTALGTLPATIVANSALVADRRYFLRITALSATGVVIPPQIYQVATGTITP